MKSSVIPIGHLNDKIIIVTGSTQGLGEAIARQAAICGAAGLIVCGRKQQAGEAVAQSIQTQTGTPAYFVRTDLTQLAECQNLITACCDYFGRVDGLVNAAGISTRGTIENTDAALFDELISVNLKAPFFMMQAAIKVMQQQQIQGSIVNIASISSYGGQSYLTPYVASKAGLVALTRNVAHSQKWHRIRCNALNIGWTETPNEHAVQQQMGKGKDWLQKAAPSLPSGQLLQPPQIAKKVVFLLSDDSVPITGSIIDWDQQPLYCWD